MVHNPDPHIVEIGGVAVGFISLSTAIYLQSVTDRRCPFKYIAFYLAVGVAMIVLHLDGILPPVEGLSALKLVLDIIMALALIVSGYRIHKNLELKNPVKEIEEGLDIKRGD